MLNNLSPLSNSTSALLEFWIWSEAKPMWCYHWWLLVKTSLNWSQPVLVSPIVSQIAKFRPAETPKSFFLFTMPASCFSCFTAKNTNHNMHMYANLWPSPHYWLWPPPTTQPNIWTSSNLFTWGHLLHEQTEKHDWKHYLPANYECVQWIAIITIYAA